VIGATRSQKNWRFIVVACVAALAAAGCGSSSKSGTPADVTRPSVPAATDTLKCAGPKATGAPVTIGFMWPQGGDLVNQPEVGAAARATVKYANDCLGGIAGRPVALNECPDKEDQASVTACANQFIEAKVDAVAVSATALPDAIAKPVTDAGIPYTSANGVSTEQILPNAFIWGSGAGGALGAIAAYARDNQLPSVAVVTSEALVSQLKAFAQPAFDSAGVKLQLVGIPASSADMTPQLRTALTSNPGALAVVGDATACISFLQATKALQVKQPVIVIQTCTAKPVVDAVGAATLNGKVITGTDEASNDSEAVLYRAVLKKYSPDTDPFGFASFGYLSILSPVRAVAGITGAVTPATLTAAMGRNIARPLPLGAGIKFNCGVTYFQKPVALPAICAGSALVGVVKNTVPSDMKPVNIAPLFGGK
jgi:branched-chain amino acid transport system substrate-binding protein